MRVASVALLWAGLAGCAVGPDYRRPEVDVPGSFRGGPPPPAPGEGEPQQPVPSLADLPWWEVFGDPTLQDLIVEAVAGGYDLRIAVARVEQSRAIAAQVRSEFLPQVGYQGTIARSDNAALGDPTLGGGGTSTSALAVIGAAWEVDLRGRIRRSSEAALAELLAGEEARRGVLLSLTAEVAQAWFELLGLDHELEISRRTVETFGESLDIFNQRYEGGTASKLQVLRAQAEVSRTAAAVSVLERAIALKENQICVLLGRNPGPVARTSALLDQAVPPEVPAGLPSDLLERRPDLREAEERLVAANARIGVAEADFFPRIGLTTVLGRASADIDQFSSGSSSLWSIGAGLAGPLFTGGRLSAAKRQAVAEWEEARLGYLQAVQFAFREVADALLTRQTLEEERIQRATTVASLEEAVTMANDLYVAGRASYYELLEAQQQLFPAETSLSRTRTEQLVVIVSLYRALGGGWNLDDAAWARQGP